MTLPCQENDLFYVPEFIANKCGVKFAGNVKDMGVMGRSKINCPTTLFYIGIIVALAFLLLKENAIVVALVLHLCAFWNCFIAVGLHNY